MASNKTELIRFRVSPEEKAAIVRSAGTTQVSAWIRDRVLESASANGLSKEPDAPVHPAALDWSDDAAAREADIQQRMAADKPAFSQQKKRQRAIEAMKKAGLYADG